MITTSAVRAQKDRHNETILLSPPPPPPKKKKKKKYLDIIILHPPLRGDIRNGTQFTNARHTVQ